MSKLGLRKVVHGRVSRRLLSWGAASAPIWLSACGPGVPALDIWAAGELFPTRTSVLVQVSAPASASGCGTHTNDITLVEARCGEGCTVEDAGPGTQGGTIAVRMTVTAPGVQRLEVVVDDAELGARAGSVDLEFAEVTRLETTHDAKRDPGTALPILRRMEARWCAHAFAADEREVSLFVSPTTLESTNTALLVEAPLATMDGPCWNLDAAAAGTGHLVLSAGGLSVEHSPEVIGENDVAEIHLHQMRLPLESWLPLDQAGSPDGVELTSIVAADHDFWLETVVRLVTKDGRTARASSEWFRADDEAIVMDELYAVGHGFAIGFADGPRPEASCLRATIGTAHLDLPVYIDSRPGDIENPCVELPPSSGGEGGAGGAGGMGGAGGAEP